MLKSISNEIQTMFSNKRLTRARYIAYQCIMSLVMMFSHHIIYAMKSPNNSRFTIAYLVCVIVICACVVSLSIWFTIRRLHDLDSSVKPVLQGFILLCAISLISLLLYQNVENPIANKILEYTGIISACILVISYFIIKLGCVFIAGVPYKNRFGQLPQTNNFFVLSIAGLYIIATTITIWKLMH